MEIFFYNFFDVQVGRKALMIWTISSSALLFWEKRKLKYGTVENTLRKLKKKAENWVPLMALKREIFIIKLWFYFQFSSETKQMFLEKISGNFDKKFLRAMNCERFFPTQWAPELVPNLFL